MNVNSKTYEIYLTTGATVEVKADDFEADFKKNQVTFSSGDKNIAVFSLKNICGFKLITRRRKDEK